MNILLILLAVVAVYAGCIFNRLVKLRNRVAEAWSDIDVQLKRRHDLIPNLVETVKAYGNYEQETLKEIVELRSATLKADSPNERAGLEGGISQDLKKIIALAESYPELKADKNFRDLQQALVDVEDHIQFARRYYNGSVRDLNILVQSVPSNIIARIFNFETRDFFEVELATERATPAVQI